MNLSLSDVCGGGLTVRTSVHYFLLLIIARKTISQLVEQTLILWGCSVSISAEKTNPPKKTLNNHEICMSHELTIINVRIETLLLSVSSPHGNVQEHLTCQQGARQGFHLNTGPVTRGRSKETENKRLWARKARRNLSTCALTQGDNGDRRPEFMFLKSAELRRRDASGTCKHLTTAPAGLHTRYHHCVCVWVRDGEWWSEGLLTRDTKSLRMLEEYLLKKSEP